MALRINSDAPNFTADTTQGKIDFHDWIGSVSFRDRGTRSLKGVPGEWHLFAAEHY